MGYIDIYPFLHINVLVMQSAIQTVIWTAGKNYLLRLLKLMFTVLNNSHQLFFFKKSKSKEWSREGRWTDCIDFSLILEGFEKNNWDDAGNYGLSV